METLTNWFEAERGRISKLAAALGVTPGAISQWRTVPAERMGDVSRITGIPLKDLRPDIFAKAGKAA